MDIIFLKEDVWVVNNIYDIKTYIIHKKKKINISIKCWLFFSLIL